MIIPQHPDHDFSSKMVLLLKKMKPSPGTHTLPHPAVYIHSLEPIWIDYGTFPRLPNTGEDIYCDGLNFQFGLGYALNQELQDAKVPSCWFVHYAEEVFRSMANQQARDDDLGDRLLPARQCFQASLAISAPLKSGEKKFILVDPPRKLAADQVCFSVPDQSWLVLLDWKPGESLQEVLAGCRLKNVHVCLGLALHEEKPVDTLQLLACLGEVSPVDLVFFYFPPYLPPPAQHADRGLINKLLASVPVVLIASLDELTVFQSEKEWKSISSSGNDPFTWLAGWLAAYLQSRLHGSSVAAAIDYAQSF